jgi:hypothetical protein
MSPPQRAIDRSLLSTFHPRNQATAQKYRSPRSMANVFYNFRVRGCFILKLSPNRNTRLYIEPGVVNTINESLY